MPRARFRNGNNVLLIDENYENLALRQFASVVTGPPNAYGMSYADVTFAHDQSVMAVRCSAYVAIFGTTYGPGTVTYRLIAVGGRVTVECWNFDLPKYSVYNPNHAKLIIRKPSSGEVAFDSRLKYMRVLNFQYTNGGGTTTPAITTTYPAGSQPAVVVSSQPWSMRSVRIGYPNPHTQIVSHGVGMCRCNGTTVDIAPLVTYASFNDENEGTVYPDSEMLEGYWMTLDVANLL